MRSKVQLTQQPLQLLPAHFYSSLSGCAFSTLRYFQKTQWVKKNTFFFLNFFFFSILQTSIVCISVEIRDWVARAEDNLGQAMESSQERQTTVYFSFKTIRYVSLVNSGQEYCKILYLNLIYIGWALGYSLAAYTCGEYLKFAPRIIYKKPMLTSVCLGNWEEKTHVNWKCFLPAL